MDENPFDLLRTLAHINALEASWKALIATPQFVKLLADAKTVSDDLGLPTKLKALLANVEATK